MTQTADPTASRPEPRPPPDSPARTAVACLSLGLVAGCLLLLSRLALLEQVGVKLRRVDLELCQWRLTQLARHEFVFQGLLGLAATGMAYVCWRGKRVWLLVALLVAWMCALLAIGGGPWSAAYDRLYQSALEQSWRVLALGAASLALALVICCGGGLVPHLARLRWRGALTLFVLSLTLCALVPTAYARLRAPRALLMPTREALLELVLRPELWQTASERPDAPPRAGVLTPCTDYRVDGADLPAIFMPPPSRLSFRVPADEPQAWLRIAAGVTQQEVYRRLPKEAARTFGFAVARNGKRVFEARIEAHNKQPKEECVWRRPEGGALALSAGDEIELSTWIEGESTEATLAGPAFDVGFGDVVLEVRRERARRAAAPQTPNIILILQDTLRADRLSCYSYGKPTTPHIDRLAQRGLRFEQAYATASWTWPSTASILTGLHPDRHGVTDDSACYLAGANRTIAEELQDRGYTTAAFTCNPLITPQKNFHQGFETFDYVAEGFRKTGRLLSDVLAWMRSYAGTRFFLYLHLVDPHHPHEPRLEDAARLGGNAPEGWRNDQFHELTTQLLQAKGHDDTGQPIEGYIPPDHMAYWNEIYDATVATGDHYVGAIVAELERLGLTEKTVIVFTSDHGEEWLDHGLLAHGQSVHRELVRVPLLMAGPGIQSGVSSAVISNRQIAPTLVGIAGGRLQGVDDALDLTDFDTEQVPPVYFSTTHGWWNGRRERQPIYGMRAGKWVLHYAPYGGDWKLSRKQSPVGGQVRLYDAEQDPAELRDVAPLHPEIAASMRERLLAHLDEQTRERPGATLGAGSATMEMLGAHGYLGPTDEEVEEGR